MTSTQTHTVVQSEITPEQALAALTKLITMANHDVTAEFADLPQLQVADLLAAWHQADAVLDLAKSKRDEVKQKIVEAMNGAEVLRIAETQQEVVTYRENTAMVLDTAKLKKDHPEITEHYLKPRTQRPFSVLV